MATNFYDINYKELYTVFRIAESSNHVVEKKKKKIQRRRPTLLAYETSYTQHKHIFGTIILKLHIQTVNW